jgi:2-haloacid dehalogenase
MLLRPLVIAFDVNETLFSLDAVGAALDDAGAPDGTLQRWFQKVLADGFALTCAGDFIGFRDLALEVLTRMLGDGSAAGTVLDAFGSLDPHPDVAPSLERLRAAGVRTVTLTNGHAEMTGHLLERAGLRHLVAACHDVGEVERWKPAPLPYEHCAQRNDVTPERMAMVAVHAWDIHGAKRAGLVTGYASRHEGGAAAHFAPADVSAENLVGVIDGLLALPER